MRTLNVIIGSASLMLLGMQSAEPVTPPRVVVITPASSPGNFDPSVLLDTSQVERP